MPTGWGGGSRIYVSTDRRGNKGNALGTFAHFIFLIDLTEPRALERNLTGGSDAEGARGKSTGLLRVNGNGIGLNANPRVLLLTRGKKKCR